MANNDNINYNTTATATYGNVTISIENNRPLKNGEHPYTVEDFITAMLTLLESQALSKSDLRNIASGLDEEVNKPTDYDM